MLTHVYVVCVSEAYHVPNLKAYLELLRHLEHDATRCIINGKPKKTWKPGESEFRRKENITDKKTKFLMFDIEGKYYIICLTRGSSLNATSSS